MVRDKAMISSTADVVICGAGIAGISVAYHLAVKYDIKNVVLIEEHTPLSLTSDKSTECYRNWWPGPGDAMVSLMNRSIDILEGLAHESDNFFHLNRRGYVFATANPTRIADFKRTAEESAELSAGPVRSHKGQPGDLLYAPAPPQGFENQPIGSDLILDPVIIRKHFPYLTEQTVALIHARRCGWFSAQQLGMYMLERARERGARLLQAISARNFVNAAGPFLKDVGQMVGIDLPVFSELHAKIAFKDSLGTVPRDAPMIIWTDSMALSWSEQERSILSESEETKWLLGEFPSGIHARPEGSSDSNILLALWSYDIPPVEPVFPITFDQRFPEIIIRGLAAVIPGMKAYLGRIPKPLVDGGYYTKTRENRPLIGPLPIEGAYVIGALSGLAPLCTSFQTGQVRRSGVSEAAGELERIRAVVAGYKDTAPSRKGFHGLVIQRFSIRAFGTVDSTN
jgi:glycine/D-amino acid oxidase-like deaminating enzyme